MNLCEAHINQRSVQWTWSAVITTSRESSHTLENSLAALHAACLEPTLIDVVVNGNPELARQISEWVEQLETKPNMPTVSHRVWHIAQADKANALNEFIHKLWPGAPVTFFMDGYVSPDREALKLLADSLATQPEKLAAAALPSTGYSAHRLRRTMQEFGGIHGNLFALAARTMQTFRTEGFRLPLGLYRTDSTIGSYISLGLNPAQRQWAPKAHIATAEEATWAVPNRQLNWAEIKLAVMRRLRQASGDMENWAVRHWMHISGLHPAGWPATSKELVHQWHRHAPADFSERLAGDPLRRVGMRLIDRKRLHPIGHEALRVKPVWPHPSAPDAPETQTIPEVGAKVGVCMFAYNESRYIRRALDAIGQCASEAEITVHVMINGCTDDTEAIVRAYRPQRFRVVPVVLKRGDKANAWNHYVHDMAQTGQEAFHVHVFTDGDMQVQPGSIRGMVQAFRSAPLAMGCSGLPVSGRSQSAFREKLIMNREMAGNLYALRTEMLNAFRTQRVRLPVGQFGEDGLVTTLVKFELAPDRARQDERITHSQEGGFWYPPLSALNPADWKIYRNRNRRYAMRKQQANMLYPRLYRHGISAMPGHVNELYLQHPAGVETPSRDWIEAYFDRQARIKVQTIVAAMACAPAHEQAPAGEDASLYS